jgi:hypothetical protein
VFWCIRIHFTLSLTSSLNDLLADILLTSLSNACFTQNLNLKNRFPQDTELQLSHFKCQLKQLCSGVILYGSVVVWLGVAVTGCHDNTMSLAQCSCLLCVGSGSVISPKHSCRYSHWFEFRLTKGDLDFMIGLGVGYLHDFRTVYSLINNMEISLYNLWYLGLSSWGLKDLWTHNNTVFVAHLAVMWLRWLHYGFWPLRLGINPSWFQVTSVVGKVALEQAFPRVFQREK